MKKLFNGLETDYLDGFQYKFTHTWEAPSGTMASDEMKLRIIPTSEGYFDALRNTYFYNYTDHLGNVRLSYSDRDGNNEVTGDIVVNNCVDTPDGQFCNNYIISGEAEGVTNYYPFGMIHNNEYNNFDNAYQNKYNGKELQETGMYDYGARFYMPDIGRWGVVDPLAEMTPHLSSYHYGNNNPVRFTDPDGRQSWDNLTTYNPGSAVASFMNRNGFGDDYMPLVFRDDAGMMMTSAIGDDGQGGGAGLTATNGSIRSLMNYFNKNGINNDSVDFLFANYKRGTVSWWTDSDGAQYGQFNALKLSQGLSDNWYGLAGKGNWFYGTGAVLTGFAGIVQSQSMYTQGYRRGLSGNYQLTGRNLSQFGKMPMTSATAPISKLARGAKIAGHFSFGLGVITDVGGIMTGKVSFGKAILNTGFGVAGNWGGSIGASLSTVYFGVDNFYNGGWPQLFDDGNMVQGKLDEGFNQAGPYRINVFGAHEPK
ncbi:RHS repeat-associated core domain-containing protein [Chryseobacterium sp. 3008163]|uniref:RHS repeat-associated core domain-containing protein n=1 Tax=Chryseobacterium sp. 3008163 TaxID=2478663 RepID=UPI0026998CD0|nr:RHS repeat-associated core domain-containing protein [Chryseobacterium sp. 3008163]